MDVETRRTSPRAAGYSFCIITDGRRPQRLLDEIASIRALELSACEIIVVGEVTVALSGAVVLAAPALARQGRLGALRNLACAHASFDHLIVADDDMLFHRDFGRALDQLRGDVDVTCVRLLNPDGSRYWDWATHGGARGHVLLDYDETDANVYVTGGLAIMKAAVHDVVQWDGARGFYAGEDLDWSARLRAAGFHIGFCAEATVTHCDARYSQRGRGISFRQDLSLPERLVSGLEGIGFFRPIEPGFWWMTTAGTLVIAADPAVERVLRFSLASAAPPLLDGLLRVAVQRDGAELGTLTFNGAQSMALALPVPAGAPLHVQLQSDRTTRGTDVALGDERPVSVLLHDVEVRLGR